MANMETPSVDGEKSANDGKDNASSKTLIELTDELSLALEQAENEPELSAEIEERLVNALTGHAEKVDRAVAFVRRCDAEVQWLESEKKAIDDQIKRVKRKQKSMKYIAGIVMTYMKERKIQGLRGNWFSFRKSSRLEVTDKSQIPAEFKSIKTEEVVDKALIKKRLKSGESVPGVELREFDNVIIN